MPSVKFVVEKDCIRVLNNECGFAEKNIRAICDVGRSTKGKHKFGYIGGCIYYLRKQYFGICCKSLCMLKNLYMHGFDTKTLLILVVLYILFLMHLLTLSSLVIHSFSMEETFIKL